MLWLLIKAGTDVNVLSQRRCTAANSISIVLGMVNILKYLVEFGACTPFIIRMLACIYCLKKN